jgi:hypothetical protein
MNDDMTMVTVIGVFLLIGQLMQLYNTAVTAKKNATEPLQSVRKVVLDQTKKIAEIEHDMDVMKKDSNRAFDKIRENKAEQDKTAKAQNAALIQILLLLKEPEKRNDQDIDRTIKELSAI